MDMQQRNADQSPDGGEPKHGEEMGRQDSTPQRSVTRGAAGKSGGAYKEIIEWIKALVIAVVLVFVIRQFLFSPYIVDGSSMKPNFETGERLIVNKIIYTFKEPQFGDVVVFNVPQQGRKFVKRVIGVPGDVVKLEGDELFINGEKVDEPYIADAIAAAREQGGLYNGTGLHYNFPNDANMETTVPEGSIFALGDNRSDSQDSRAIGFVDEKEIVGRADVIFWPLNKIEFIKHRY